MLGLTFMDIACVGDTLYAPMTATAGAGLSRFRIRFCATALWLDVEDEEAAAHGRAVIFSGRAGAARR